MKHSSICSHIIFVSQGLQYTSQPPLHMKRQRGRDGDRKPWIAKVLQHSNATILFRARISWWDVQIHRQSLSGVVEIAVPWLENVRLLVLKYLCASSWQRTANYTWFVSIPLHLSISQPYMASTCFFACRVPDQFLYGFTIAYLYYFKYSKNVLRTKNLLLVPVT